MYKVIYYGTRGGCFTKEFEKIDQATNFALQHYYGFDSIQDTNGDIIFDNIDNRDNGIFKFSRTYRPL